MKLTTYKVRTVTKPHKYYCNGPLFGLNERLQGVTEYAGAVEAALAYEDAMREHPGKAFEVIKSKEIIK